MRMLWLSVMVAMSGCVPSVSGDAGVDSGVEDAGVPPASCLVALKASCGADAGKTTTGIVCIYDGEYDGGNGLRTSVFTAAGDPCATFIEHSYNMFCEGSVAQWLDADGNVVATSGRDSSLKASGVMCVDGGPGGAWVTF